MSKPLTPEQVTQHRRSATLWKMEVSIMESCITLANQLITQLESSGGDHWEDIEEIQGLQTVWEALRLNADESAKYDKYYSARGEGR